MRAKRISAERTARRAALDPTRYIDPCCEGRCGTRVFPHVLEQHHIVPLGETEHSGCRYLCFLCPNCHKLVHIFRRLLHGKLARYEAEDLVEWSTEANLPPGYTERIEAIARANIAELERDHGFVFKLRT